MVEFQPSKLAVVGSNPIARSSEDVKCETLSVRGEAGIEPTTVGISKGVSPFRGECARGLAPSAGVSEAGFRAELTTECGSNPIARSKRKT